LYDENNIISNHPPRSLPRAAAAAFGSAEVSCAATRDGTRLVDYWAFLRPTCAPQIRLRFFCLPFFLFFLFTFIVLCARLIKHRNRRRPTTNYNRTHYARIIIHILWAYYYTKYNVQYYNVYGKRGIFCAVPRHVWPHIGRDPKKYVTRSFADCGIDPISREISLYSRNNYPSMGKR